MQINPIFNNLNIYNKTAQNTSFKGLWGKTTAEVPDKDPALSVMIDTETYYYHPYIDETREEVQKVLDENSKAYFDETSDEPRYVVKECKLCTTLPFKKVQFDSYMAADSSTRMSPNLRRVHFCVADKYLNKDLDAQQSATNEALKAKINTKA